MANLEKRPGNAPRIPDRRCHLRRGLAALAYVELGADNGGIVFNLSEGGLAAQSAHVLTKRHLPQIRFQLPPSRKWIKVSANVVWVGESGKKAGLEFIDLPHRARFEIEEWVSTGQSLGEVQEEAVSIGERGSKLVEMRRARESKPAAPRSESSEQAAEKVLQAICELRNASAHPPETQVPSPAPPSADLNGPLDTPTFTFAAHTAGDRVEGAIDRRRWPSPLATFGAVLVLAFFVVGLRFGQGSWDALLGHLKHLRYAVGVTATPKEIPSATVLPSPSVPAIESNRQQPEISSSPQFRSSEEPGVNASSPGDKHAQAQPLRTVPTGQRDSKIALEIGSSYVRQNTILVGAPEGSLPVRLDLPEEAVSASASVAITSRRSILVPPVSGPQPFPKTENLRLGALLSRVEPRYPPEAIEKHVDGTVQLHAVVGRMGEVEDVKLKGGPKSLTAAAMGAVRAWRYDPTLINGQPVETEADINMTFRLP